VVLQAHLGAELCKALSMVCRLKLQVQLAGPRYGHLPTGVQKHICSEHDALAQEVSKNVVNRHVLDFPVQSVEYVRLHADEVAVGVEEAGDVDQLLEAGVGFLEIFGRDKHGDDGDEHQDGVSFLLGAWILLREEANAAEVV